MPRSLHPATIAITAGRPARTPDGPLSEPVTLASAFHAGGPNEYARDGHPGFEAFEQAIGALEPTMTHFRAMPGPPATWDDDAEAGARLRGLAPHLRSASLAGPPGSWGRATERLGPRVPGGAPREPVTA